MSSAAEFQMRIYELQRQQRLREFGVPVVRDVLSRDSSHQSPDYEKSDPFYIGPPIARMADSTLYFANVTWPDSDEGLSA